MAIIDKNKINIISKFSKVALKLLNSLVELNDSNLLNGECFSIAQPFPINGMVLKISMSKTGGSALLEIGNCFNLSLEGSEPVISISSLSKIELDSQFIINNSDENIEKLLKCVVTDFKGILKNVSKMIDFKNSIFSHLDDDFDHIRIK